MKQSATPTEGGASPWGEIQVIEKLSGLGAGAVFVSTAGHGGYWLPPELRELVPLRWQRFAGKWALGFGPGWYEEDCAAIAVGAFVLKHPRAIEDLPHMEAALFGAKEAQA